MKNLMLRLLILLWLFVISGQAWGGAWTANGFVYKPEMGARGTEAKTLFDSGMDRLDARLGKEIWVGDPDYGSTLQDAITAISTDTVCLRVPAGTHSIAGDLTIPANIRLRVERGAILLVASGKTMTISGPLDAGLYQIFAGDGSVVFGTGREVYPEWWGAVAGGASCEAALQAAANSIETPGGTIKLQAGTYTFTQFSIPVDVNLVGSQKNKTVLLATGNGILGSGKWVGSTFSDFTVSNEGNVNIGQHLIDAQYGATQCEFSRICLIPCNGTDNGIYIRGANPGGAANNNCFNNKFELIRAYGAGTGTGAAIRVGDDDTVSGKKGNGNLFLKCVLGSWADCIRIMGYDNNIVSCYMYPVTNGVHVVSNTGTSTRINVTTCGFEFSGAAVPIRITYNHDVTRHVLTVDDCVGIDDITSHIAIDGTHPENAMFTYRGLNTVLGGPYRNRTYSSINSPQINPVGNDAFLKLFGGQDESCGRILVGGKTYTGSSRLSQSGVSLGIGYDPLAALRFYSADSGGGLNVKMFEMAFDGGISSLTSTATKTISAVDTEADILTIATHGLLTADRVTFRQTGGADPNPLVSGTRYYVIKVDDNTIKLATTSANAVAGTAINITTGGSGTLTLVTGGATGSITLANATTSVVDNAAVNTTSIVYLSPTNAAAITYEKAHGRPYVTVANGKFTLTGDGAAFGGTETYKYLVVN